MAEPLPDDPVLLRALLSEAARFLDGVSAPLAKLRKLRNGFMRAIDSEDPRGEFERQHQHFCEAQEEFIRAMDEVRPHLTLLLDHIAREEATAISEAVTDIRRKKIVVDAITKLDPSLLILFYRNMRPKEASNPLVILETAVRRVYAEIGAKLKAAERSGCPVRLNEREEFPVIRGVKVPPLTIARYSIVRAVIAAWPNGLKKDQLIKVTGQGDAHNTFKAIRKLSPEWESVLILPGQIGRGSGYRIARE